MRILFIGKPHAFSLLPLEELEREHEIVGIVESAPRGSGREGGKHLRTRLRNWARPSALEKKARAGGATYMYLSRDNRGELDRFVADAEPDAICVASLSQLLSKAVLAIPPMGSMNLHPSLLPKYHGPFPWFWQYHDFELEVGATVHVIDEGQDTGPILKQVPVTLEVGTDIADAMALLGRVGGGLMADAARELEKGTASPIPQPAHTFPKARIVERHERFIDWEAWPIERVWHFMRGTYPWVDPVEYPPEWSGVRTGGYEKASPDAEAGTVHRDEDGYFVAHPEGKIRLILAR